MLLNTCCTKKIQSGARSLFDSHLDLHSTKYADVSMVDTISLCEFLFMNRSNPRAALVSLTRIPKLLHSDKDFYKIQSTISRLAKISFLNESDTVRDILFQTRCLSAFMSAITMQDCSYIEAENTR